MKLAWPIEIIGTGMGIPGRVVTNDEIAHTVDTSNEWIVQRTGIHERRWVRPGEETTLSLAAMASRAALEQAGLTPADVDSIIVATVTPEHQLPATACLLQAELGCRWIPAFDLEAACSGYAWAFTVAAQQIINGLARTVLLLGAETLSNITDMQDRSTCILFGDAAGATLLRATDRPGRGVLAVRQGADGSRGRLIYIPGGGARAPVSHDTVAARLHYMHMAGREVYKFAVTQMHAIIEETCADAGVAVSDLTLIIPHQSNLRIIESACQKAGVPMDKVLVNIHRYGNTSAASIPVALHEARAAGRLPEGSLLLLVAFGAGLTWGSVLIRV